MIFRTILAKDDERRGYIGKLDYFGIELTVEVFPAWQGDKPALEVRVMPPERGE